MQRTPVWLLLDLARCLSGARNQREEPALSFIPKMTSVLCPRSFSSVEGSSRSSEDNIGHLFKQLGTLNSSLAELLTQVSQQEGKQSLEKRTRQVGKRNEGLYQLVDELQHWLVAGMKQREKFNKKLKLLEVKMEDAAFFKPGELSLTKVAEIIMVSGSLLILVDCDFDRLENKLQWQESSWSYFSCEKPG